MLNQITLMGRVVANPTQKGTEEKKFYCFTLAVQTPKEDITYFFDINSSSKGLELVHKGDKVAITGYLRQNKWISKDGTNRSSVDIIADKVEFIELKPQAGVLEDTCNPTEE